MKNNVKVVCITSDKYMWALKPFSFMFNRYWDEKQEVMVAAYSTPEGLPSNFSHMIIDNTPYPAEKYVDGLIRILSSIKEEFVVLLLEDYWMYRPVDLYAIDALSTYMSMNHNILRVDLTGDRLYAGGMMDIGFYEHYDIIEAPQSQYQLSMQAGLWNRALLLDVCHYLPKNLHSPWDLELEGTTIVNKFGERMKVIGTRQWPVRYANAVLKGKIDYKELTKLSVEESRELLKFAPEEIK